MGSSPDDRKQSDIGRVTFLEDDLDGAVVESERLQRATGSKVRPVLMVLAILSIPGLLGLSFLLNRSSGDDSDRAGAEGAEVVDDNSEPVPFDELRAYGSGGVQRDNRYSEVNSAIGAMVVAGTVGDDLPLFGSTRDLQILGPGNRPVINLQLDASGNWLAGTYRNKFDQVVLLVGQTDGPDDWVMEPVAVDVNGWSWHPHEAGKIAFAKPSLFSKTNVTIEDLTAPRVISRRFVAEFPGRLRMWGDWGFAFDEPGPVQRTTVTVLPDVISPPVSGALVTLASGVPGRAKGELGLDRILIDGDEGITIVNLNNAVFERNVWIDETAEVFAMAGSPDGNFSVVLVGGRGSSAATGGKVLLLASDPTGVPQPSELLFATTGPTTFDWTPDGRFVAGFQPAVINNEGERVSPASVTVYDLNRALFQGREVRLNDGTEPDLRFRIGAIAFRETLPE